MKKIIVSIFILAVLVVIFYIGRNMRSTGDTLPQGDKLPSESANTESAPDETGITTSDDAASDELESLAETELQKENADADETASTITNDFNSTLDNSAVVDVGL